VREVATIKTEIAPPGDAPDYLLNRWAADVFSQTGEDGIIDRILTIIGERDNWAVEFGAWDGLHFSNCANLFRNKDYSGVFVEANPVKYKDLLANYEKYPKVKALNTFVGFGPKDNLDVLLAGIPIPQNFDFLSIDIDGNDYHVWNAITKLRPKLIVVEFNPTIPTEVDYVQEADPRVQRGSSITGLTRLGKEKGYELVCCTPWNGFYVDAKYFPKFQIPDNSVRNLRRDLSLITHLFSGYDGKIMLAGNRKMLWHVLDIEEERVQMLPKSLIGFPADYSPFQNFLFKWLHRFRRKR
jgi:hypothetical protein